MTVANDLFDRLTPEARAHVDRVVASAPPMSDEVRARLRTLFRRHPPTPVEQPARRAA